MTDHIQPILDDSAFPAPALPPLAIDFFDPCPPAPVGDPWFFHLCMPGVEWPEPVGPVLRPDGVSPSVLSLQPTYVPPDDDFAWGWFLALSVAALACGYLVTRWLILPL